MVYSMGRVTVCAHNMVNLLLHTYFKISAQEFLRTVVPILSHVASRIFYLYFVKVTFCTFISFSSFDFALLMIDWVMTF